ncbi:protein kinase-like domain-containing protein [Artemisia annua]|uniref:Protein kinase-like domain-containing protein n=1 Tax=Artemisia annua TaxID=35608 RepID=A0A2U1LN96_ARTAN|nr:protein kinase-like domain-containing protein [Artemisia annua]
MQKISNCSETIKSLDFGKTPLMYSKSHNKFVVEGCGNALMMYDDGSVITGCSTTCLNNTISDTNNKCIVGISCCQTTIPHYLKSYRMNLTGLASQMGGDRACGSAFLTDKDLYEQFAVGGADSAIPTSLLWTLAGIDKNQANLV